MTEWLYRLKLVRADFFQGPTAAEMQAMGEHLAYLKTLASQGKLILAGRTQVNDAHTMGLGIFRADGEAEARAVVAADPAVLKGVMTAELFPYKVAVAGTFTAS